MGIINLKWHKAGAVRGVGFTKDEQAAGWPESFALHRLAILQSPTDNKMANILHRALKDACEAGSLPNAPATARKIGYETKTYLETNSFVRRNVYGEREPYYRTQLVPVMKDVEVPAVTAADFAAWLAAQGEAPSEHIAAWFDAVGVADTAKPAQTPEPEQDATPDVSILKKHVLADRHRRRWPSIDNDLKDASRNGLNIAMSGKHGYWKEDTALKWAEQNGKLTKPQSIDNLPSRIFKF